VLQLQAAGRLKERTQLDKALAGLRTVPPVGSALQHRNACYRNACVAWLCHTFEQAFAAAPLPNLAFGQS